MRLNIVKLEIKQARPCCYSWRLTYRRELVADKAESCTNISSAIGEASMAMLRGDLHGVEIVYNGVAVGTFTTFEVRHSASEIAGIIADMYDRLVDSQE